MNRQKSFIDNKPILYLVATPIGNLEDITYRAIKILNSVFVCFAEDTRVTKVLFNHYNIETPLETYQEHNKEVASSNILKYLEDGHDVALVSDAGNPIVSDPGFLVCKRVIEKGYSVVPIPGASASLSALISSGIDATSFTFYGFLDSRQAKRIKELKELKEKKETLIFYEAPHRIRESLEDMLEVLGDRDICLCREMTKKFEEFIRGSISEVLTIIDELKGEMVVIVSGNKEDGSNYQDISPIDQIDELILAGMAKNNAIKAVAKRMNIDKNELYKEYINEKEKLNRQ